MEDCLIFDSDEENYKIYEPDELNKLLLENTKIIANKYDTIHIVGDIIDYKEWKRGGCSFKITQNNNSIDCKAWVRDGLNPENIKEYKNKNCLIIGNIQAEYFYGHKFVINVKSIKIKNENTKLNELKTICETNGYFKNKKEIEWFKIKKIGIISKKNTQGYNDFCNQLMVPLDIILNEITLEGFKTCKDCIDSIINLEKLECDLILIIRGGGDTSEISNSFDKVELFEIIKKSKIPIITAIGHEQDKGDKLLITNVSDLDFPTPSTASIEINKILFNPLIEKLNDYLDKNEILFNRLLEKEIEKVYNGLNCFIKQFLKNIFGGEIIQIQDDDKEIIIYCNDKYYKNIISFNNQLHFSKRQIDLKNELLNAIETENISVIYDNFNKLNTNQSELTENILEYIDKIKTNEKLKLDFEKCKEKKRKTYYLKKIPNTNDFKILIQIKQIILWYIKILEDTINGLDNEYIKDIYNYLDKI